MNRGRGRSARGFYSPRGRRSPRSGDNSARGQGPVVDDGSSDDVRLGQKANLSHIREHTSGEFPTDVTRKQLNHKSTSDCSYQKDTGSSAVGNINTNLEKVELVQNSPEAMDQFVKQDDCLPASGSKSNNERSLVSGPLDKHFLSVVDNNLTNVPTEFSLIATPANKEVYSKKSNECWNTSNEKTIDRGRSDGSDCLAMGETFDICPESTGTPVRLKTPLLVKNREKRNESKRSMEGQEATILRPGMILLKRYISCTDQVKIVKTCRQLGLGSGGFYQPGYRDGAKMHLKMMCLGKDWDPETSQYGERRSLDGAKPPQIPREFHQLVNKAIQDSHTFLLKQFKPKDVESIIPPMTPDICIVNFYANSGRLGLHQDKDESPKSLNNGIPVVSISIGDSADFLFGDQRDVDKAEKVLLESGDVLIFGGKSRHVFHGVTCIHSNTAPQPLLEESNIRPGRLNLTFREY